LKSGAAGIFFWDGGIPIPPKTALGELELTHPKGIKNKNNKWDGGIPIPPKTALGELELTHPKDKNP